MAEALSELRDRGIIEDAESLRMVYWFAEEQMWSGKSAGSLPGGGSKVVDKESGEAKGKAEIE